MTTNKPYYQYHVFFCTNSRDDPNKSACQQYNAQAMRDYMKAKTKALGIACQYGVRINTAGCLNRCELGPVIVVYPQGVWYSYIDEEDIDEIIEQHLLKHQIVDRLQL